MIFSKANIFSDSLKTIATRLLYSPESSNFEQSDIDVLNQFLEAILKEQDPKAKSPFKLLLPKVCLPHVNPELVSQLGRTLCVILEETDLAQLDDAASYSYGIQLQRPEILKVLPPRVTVVIVDYQFAEKLEKVLPYVAKKFQLIIELVEEYSQFNSLKAKGVQHFSGTFIEKPEKLSESNIPTNKASVMNLIMALNRPNVEINEISKVIVSDNILSYKLLRIVNSPIFRGVSEINSIQEAVVRFGFENLKKWVLMLSLCNVSDKPLELMQLALIRAFLCSKMSPLFTDKAIEEEVSYTAGLLSTLDAFIDFPMEALLTETALAADVKDAILSGAGPLGEFLTLIKGYQQGILSEQLQKYPTISNLYIESVNETKEVLLITGA